jgi:hypothetical protein
MAGRHDRCGDKDEALPLQPQIRLGPLLEVRLLDIDDMEIRRSALQQVLWPALAGRAMIHDHGGNP